MTKRKSDWAGMRIWAVVLGWGCVGLLSGLRAMPVQADDGGNKEVALAAYGLQGGVSYLPEAGKTLQLGGKAGVEFQKTRNADGDIAYGALVLSGNGHLRNEKDNGGVDSPIADLELKASIGRTRGPKLNPLIKIDRTDAFVKLMYDRNLPMDRAHRGTAALGGGLGLEIPVGDRSVIRGQSFLQGEAGAARSGSHTVPFIQARLNAGAGYCQGFDSGRNHQLCFDLIGDVAAGLIQASASAEGRLRYEAAISERGGRGKTLFFAGPNAKAEVGADWAGGHKAVQLGAVVGIATQ